MTENKLGTNNHEIKLDLKNKSVNLPATLFISCIPSMLLLCVPVGIFYGVFFTDKIPPDSNLQLISIIVSIVIVILSVVLFMYSKSREDKAVSAKEEAEVAKKEAAIAKEEAAAAKEEANTIKESFLEKNGNEVLREIDSLPFEKFGLKYLNDSVFVTTDQSILHEYMESSFKKINNGDEVHQTFIGAFPISGSRDLIDKTPHDNSVTVKRLFAITSPYEINFLAASKEKEIDLIKDTNGKHKLTNTMLALNLPENAFRHLANITLFNEFALITFKSKKASWFPDSEYPLKKRFPPLFADDTVSLCVGMTGGNASRLIYSNYASLITPRNPLSLLHLKEKMYKKEPIEYLVAIAYSVAKEVAFLDEFNPYLKDNKGKDKLGYIGIVGSLADIMKNEKKDDGKMPNDIDLLFFINNDCLDAVSKIYQSARYVAKRFSIDGVLTVKVCEDICPQFESTENTVSIQIIVNDYSPIDDTDSKFNKNRESNGRKKFIAAMEPSVFTMATRLHCNLSLYGNLSDFYSTNNLQYSDMLSTEDRFSIHGLIYIAKEKKVYTRYWDQSLKVMIEDPKPKDICREEALLINSYCIKWGLINLYFASQLNTNGISFDQIQSKMLSKIDSSIDVESKNISEQECLLVLNKIKAYAENKSANN